MTDNIKSRWDNLSEETTKKKLSTQSVAGLVEIMLALPKETITRLFLLCSPLQQRALITDLPLALQEFLITELSDQMTKNLIAEMEPDDLVNLIQSLSPSVRSSIWEHMSEEVKRETEFLLLFEEDEAAGLMTPRYAAVRGEITVAQALAFIRRSMSKMETIYYIYVVDQFKRLSGVLSLREILASDDKEKVCQIMKKSVVSVHEDTDQEEVAKVLEGHNFISLPVVDHYNKLLGIVTFDDVIDVIREEQTEDIYKMGAMDGNTESYLTTSLLGLVRKRLPWLAILLMAGTITSNVIAAFQPLLAGYVFLALFIPIITQTGGNSGTQSATLMIRGLSTGEIHFRDIGKIMGKEVLVGILLGLATGLIIWARSYFMPPGVAWLEASVIALSLSATVLFATVLGAMAPLLIHKIGWDPTVAAGPLMTTLIDICGLTIFFHITYLLFPH